MTLAERTMQQMWRDNFSIPVRQPLLSNLNASYTAEHPDSFALMVTFTERDGSLGEYFLSQWQSHDLILSELVEAGILFENKNLQYVWYYMISELP